MATISIELKELGEGYVQYQSVTAEISIDSENYILDSRLLDNEDYQADLDVLHGFIGVWEMRAEAEGLGFYIDDDVTQLVIELAAMLDTDEDGRETFLKNLKVDDEVYWTDPEGKTSGHYKIMEFLTDESVLLTDGFTELEAYLSELS